MCIGKSVFRLHHVLVLAIGLLWATNFAHAQDSAGDGAAAAPAAASADGLSTDPGVVAEGKGIFQGNCAQCHAVHEQVVGPKLAGVYERQSLAWLQNFIKYPEKTIKSGDAHAAELYAQYKQYMPNHDFLSDKDIVAILSYVKDETVKGPAKVAATDATVGDTDTKQSKSSVSADLLLAIIAGLVVVLVVILVVMVMLASVLTKYIKQEKGLSEEDKEFLDQRFTLASIYKNQVVLVIAGFIFVALSGKAVIDGLFTIGVQQGYAPEQPIPFSHKLHAGYYQIECKYCHSTVEKSKHASIPSANVCMNCHNTIKTNSPEIQKIYSAIENNEPIQWVRIHNLPDLAYFNHSQHVKVGGIECETCHGQIKEMEVVQQHSLLTMGWCIDCHRKTDVNSKGNAYYDKLVDMHASTSKKPMKVEDIGGLECAKCHY